MSVFLPGRILPVDQRSLESIHERRMVIIDKTRRMYELLTCGFKYVYLNRPRRFGKSMLLDQMYWYFVGKREYFEGLALHDLTEDWTPRPVLRLDMSLATEGIDGFSGHLKKRMTTLSKSLGLTVAEGPLSVALAQLLCDAVEKTGQKSVVLIDEYDAPLVTAWREGWINELIALYSKVFTVLKAEEDSLHFVFITGCVKFNHMNLLSTLNNLNHITFEAQWADLCGATEEEIVRTYRPELERLAHKNSWTIEETLDALRDNYDGYCFCLDNPVRMYNPLSVLKALAKVEIGSYWMGSGSTLDLINMSGLREAAHGLDDCQISKRKLWTSDVREGDLKVFFYQAGYLTLAGQTTNSYRLRLPNDEVRETLFGFLLPAMLDRHDLDDDADWQAFDEGLRAGEVERGLWGLRQLIASAAFSNVVFNGVGKEERMQFMTLALCHGARMHVVREKAQAEGTPDVVFKADLCTYVVELKRTEMGGLEAAWEQMSQRRYAEPWFLPRRTVIAVALEVRDNGRAIINFRARIYRPTPEGDYHTEELQALPRWNTVLKGEEEGEG